MSDSTKLYVGSILVHKSGERFVVKKIEDKIIFIDSVDKWDEDEE